MNGLVLAAGAGRRLRPHTDRLPKALVPIRDDGTSVLDETLTNFAAAGCERVSIVVGYRAEAIAARVATWEATHGLAIDLVENDKAEEWNNAYSLWCARDVLAGGVVLANGDTLHPLSVTMTMLEAGSGGIALALDREKRLGDEEMKVRVDADGMLRSISKLLPHDADGEYIGVTRIPAGAAGALIDALERTWQADTNAFYEAAYQLLADEGHAIETRPIGSVSWIEIDDLADLARAQELLSCRS
jgi:choline kinase